MLPQKLHNHSPDCTGGRKCAGQSVSAPCCHQEALRSSSLPPLPSPHPGSLPAVPTTTLSGSLPTTSVRSILPLPPLNLLKPNSPSLSSASSAIGNTSGNLRKDLSETNQEYLTQSVIKAASRGQLLALSRLVRNGADVNQGDYDRRRPLHLAASEGHLDTVSALIEEYHATIDAKDRFGHTALDDAIRHAHPHVADYLISKGAHVGDPSAYEQALLASVAVADTPAVRRLLACGVNPSCYDKHQRTPLLIAVAGGNQQLASMLLECGANPALTDSSGISALSLCERHGSPSLRLLFQEHGFLQTSRVNLTPFNVTFLSLQVILLILYALCTSVAPDLINPNPFSTPTPVERNLFPLFQDLHVMVFIGFGYIMTLMRNSKITGLGTSFLVAAFAVEWYILCNGFWARLFDSHLFDYHAHSPTSSSSIPSSASSTSFWPFATWDRISITPTVLLQGDLCAGSILVTLGVLGNRVSSFQMLIIALFQVIFFALNEEIAVSLRVSDIGGAMIVHLFGTCFGIAAAMVTVSGSNTDKHHFNHHQHYSHHYSQSDYDDYNMLHHHISHHTYNDASNTNRGNPINNKSYGDVAHPDNSNRNQGEYRMIKDCHSGGDHDLPSTESGYLHSISDTKALSSSSSSSSSTITTPTSTLSPCSSSIMSASGSNSGSSTSRNASPQVTTNISHTNSNAHAIASSHTTTSSSSSSPHSPPPSSAISVSTLLGLGPASAIVLDRARADQQNKSTRSNLVAVLATLLLWLLWPSLNAVLASGVQQHRALLNTVLSLSSSCLSALLAAHVLRGSHFDVTDVQSATLAGGVAMAASADMIISPTICLLIGGLAGISSVLAHVYIEPWLRSKFFLTDECRAFNIHGVPAIIGAIFAAILAYSASLDLYGLDSLATVFPAMADGCVLHTGPSAIAAVTAAAALTHSSSAASLAAVALSSNIPVSPSPSSPPSLPPLNVPHVSVSSPEQVQQLLASSFTPGAGPLNPGQDSPSLSSTSSSPPQAIVCTGVRRSSLAQACVQAIFMMVTVALATLGGALSALLVSRPLFLPIRTVFLSADVIPWDYHAKQESTAVAAAAAEAALEARARQAFAGAAKVVAATVRVEEKTLGSNQEYLALSPSSLTTSSASSTNSTNCTTSPSSSPSLSVTSPSLLSSSPLIGPLTGLTSRLQPSGTLTKRPLPSSALPFISTISTSSDVTNGHAPHTSRSSTVPQSHPSQRHPLPQHSSSSLSPQSNTHSSVATSSTAPTWSGASGGLGFLSALERRIADLEAKLTENSSGQSKPTWLDEKDN